MPNRTSHSFSAKLRGYGRRLSHRMHLRPEERLELQVMHSPVAVLGADHHRA